MAQAFNIVIPEGRSRIATDAYLPLEVDGEVINVPFELKSLGRRSSSTARDVGLNHIARWRLTHWAFGYFDAGGTIMTSARYGSPDAMKPWLDELEAYITPDLTIAGILPTHVNEELLVTVVGDLGVYPLSAVFAIQKRQWSKADYLAAADAELDGKPAYSRARALEILRTRAEYLLKRGSTLNNPSIPKKVLDTLPEFTGHQWAKNFVELVAPVVAARRAQGLPY